MCRTVVNTHQGASIRAEQWLIPTRVPPSTRFTVGCRKTSACPTTRFTVGLAERTFLPTRFTVGLAEGASHTTRFTVGQEETQGGGYPTHHGTPSHHPGIQASQGGIYVLIMRVMSLVVHPVVMLVPYVHPLVGGCALLVPVLKKGGLCGRERRLLPSQNKPS